MKSIFKLFVLAFFLVYISPSQAVNIQTFTFTQNPNFAIMEDALDPNSITNNNYRFLVTAAYHYVKNPLVVLNSAGRRTDIAVEHYHSLNFGFGYRINAQSLIGFESFFSQAKYDSKTSFGMGDTSLTYKYRITDKESPFAIALIPKLFLPTGDEDLFLSDGSIGYGGLIAIEKNLQFLQLALNLGYIHSSDAKFNNLDYRQKLLTAIGAYIPITDIVGADIEIARYNTLPISDANPNPFEIFTGVRVQATDTNIIYGGFGVGNPSDKYGNDYRIVAGLKWSPKFYEENKTPEVVDQVDIIEKTEFGNLTSLKNIYFAHNSFILSDSSREILDEHYEELNEKLNMIKIIHIEGYASKVGNRAYNLKISKQRAEQTRRYLISKGFPEEKLKIVAFGDSRSTLEDYSANRRVELRVFEK